MRRLTLQSGLAWLASAFALAAGLAIAWMDTRPHWDDAGITAGCMFVASALAAGAGAIPWLVIVLTAGPLVAAEIGAGSGVVIVALVAAIGAAAGWSLRRVMVG
jgi:hypothetical protein